eukprot:1157129-Pelagomonas_calceolata.AAC.5
MHQVPCPLSFCCSLVRMLLLHPPPLPTELLMAGADTPTAKFFINCLAEEAAFVAKDLVPRVRRVPMEVWLESVAQLLPVTVMKGSVSRRLPLWPWT